MLQKNLSNMHINPYDIWLLIHSRQWRILNWRSGLAGLLVLPEFQIRICYWLTFKFLHILN